MAARDPSRDFKLVGEQALALAHILLPEWIGGRRQGREWVGESRSNGGLGNSWSVNLDTGAFAHFGGDERGGDLIALYAALHHIDQGAALKEVADQVGIRDTPPKVNVLPIKPPVAEPPKPDPIPPDAPPVPHHFRHGAPSATYVYGDAFVVCRYDLAEGKQFSPFTWREGRWQAKAHPGPRPLYGAELLVKHKEGRVLIVEGEKCANVAREALRAYVVVTWAGGAQAVKKTDWTSLQDRDVIIWPDADDAGGKAAAHIAEILSRIASRVRIIAPSDQADGWDIADAVASGWDAKAITTWCTEHIRQVFPSLEPEEPPPSDPEDTGPPPGVDVTIVEVKDDKGESSLVSWHSLGLDLTEGGAPHPTLANASSIIQMHPKFRDKIWFDSFTGKIMQNLTGAPRQWTDSDALRLTAAIQQQLKLSKFTLRLIHEAVQHAAECNARNSLTDWLNSLRWDGVERLETWLSDTLGLDLTPYTLAVSQNWPISMIARAFVPGEQVDTMPVLEGHQGRGKSSFLKILADPWYKSIPIAFGDKDFLQAIQGAWLIEIPDMTGFSKREHAHIIATISTRSDVYRPSYGRYTEEHPRACIFAATSETDDYLQDTRGRRRYWPLRCKEIDLDSLRSQREQIFAEAIMKYRSGASWWQTPGETDREQLDRASPDLWTDRVVSYVNDIWHTQTMLAGGRPSIAITSPRILSDAIELPLKQQTDAEKKRIARIMRENGWVQIRDQGGRRWKKMDRIPT
jgi:putative DNA primase/helicase